MKTYLIEIKFGWSKYELENHPYHHMLDIQADNEEEALKKANENAFTSYLCGQKNIPLRYRILSYAEMTPTLSYTRDAIKVEINGVAGEFYNFNLRKVNA